MKLFLSLCISTLLFCYALSASTSAPNTSQAPTSKQTTKPVTSSTKPTTQTTQKPTASTSSVPVTTLAPKEECQRANASCDACLKVGSGQCVWCACKNTCTLKQKLVPVDECKTCGLSDTKWGVCWVNYEALIIACGVVGGLLLLGLTVCICCCCCCKGNNKAKYDREDARAERQKAERKAKHDDKRAERKAKTDEIRRKYGLIKEDNPYQRFDDN